jgi:phosphohistidine phosphatase SixA
MKNVCVAFLFLVGLSSCSTSTIYIVRHADRLDKSEDSPLSEAGFARAQALKDSLQLKRIDSVFVTQYRRTRQTAEPLMTDKNLNAGVYPPHPTTVIVNRLQRLKGKNALVVGHSDTILEIAKGLGTTPTKTKIESTDYDNLFIVTLKKGLFINSKTLLEKRYGVETN